MRPGIDLPFTFVRARARPMTSPRPSYTAKVCLPCDEFNGDGWAIWAIRCPYASELLNRDVYEAIPMRGPCAPVDTDGTQTELVDRA